MSGVTTQHADYKSALPKWEKCEDAAAGEDAVKAKKETYLPRPNPSDRTIQNEERYKQYLERAVYYNATGRTLQGLLGLAFAEPAKLILPPEIDYAEDDLTGSGLPIVQHAQGTLAEVLKTGRAGLLVDYPSVEAQVSLAAKANGDVRASVTFYPANAIVNWRTMRIAGKTVLSLVVLMESYEEVNGFESKIKTQYRALSFDGSTYTVEVWRQVADVNNSVLTWAVTSTYNPVRGDGTAWTEIPFQFIGAQNNDTSVDGAPLYDIAVLNLAHYRNSADYEDSAYFSGQPQFWMAGLTEEWRDHLEKNGTYVGARSVLPLPVGGSFGIAQAQPNTLAKEAMATKEAQMAALGARLIQEAVSVKTATQVDSEDAIAHSVLALCCTNLTAAYTQVLEWFAAFENVTGDASFSLPTDFSSYTLDAQTLVALIQGVQTGNIPQSDLWARLRSAGIIAATKEDEDIRTEIEAQAPAGTGLGPSDGGGDPSSVSSDASGSADSGDMGAGGDGSSAMQAIPAKTGESPGSSDNAMMAAMTDCMNKMTAAMEAMMTRPDPPVPVVNFTPAAEAPTTINVSPPAVTIESPNITVNVPEQTAPTVNIAPAAITVESPTVNISPPDITVESPTVNVAAPVVNVEAQPPMQTTVIRGPDGRAVGTRQEPIPKGKA